MKYIVITFILFLSTFAYSKESIRIAVMGLKPIGVQKPTAAKVSEVIRTDLSNTYNVTVHNEYDIKVILKEQGFVESYCSDDSCAVEIGKHLSVDKMVIGSVMRLDKKLLITIRVVDVKSGVISTGIKKTISSLDEIDVQSKIISKQLGSILYKKMTGDTLKITSQKKVKSTNKSKKTYSRIVILNESNTLWWSCIPFWSGSLNPMFLGSEVDYPYHFGVLLMLTKSVTFISGFYNIVQKYSKEKDADQYDFSGDYDKKDAALKAANDYTSAAQISFTIFAVATIIDLFYTPYAIQKHNNSIAYNKHKSIENEYFYSFNFNNSNSKRFEFSATFVW